MEWGMNHWTRGSGRPQTGCTDRRLCLAGKSGVRGQESKGIGRWMQLIMVGAAGYAYEKQVEVRVTRGGTGPLATAVVLNDIWCPLFHHFQCPGGRDSVYPVQQARHGIRFQRVFMTRCLSGRTIEFVSYLGTNKRRKHEVMEWAYSVV